MNKSLIHSQYLFLLAAFQPQHLYPEHNYFIMEALNGSEYFSCPNGQQQKLAVNNFHILFAVIPH